MRRIIGCALLASSFLFLCASLRAQTDVTLGRDYIYTVPTGSHLLSDYPATLEFDFVLPSFGPPLLDALPLSEVTYIGGLPGFVPEPDACTSCPQAAPALGTAVEPPIVIVTIPEQPPTAPQDFRTRREWRRELAEIFAVNVWEIYRSAQKTATGPSGAERPSRMESRRALNRFYIKPKIDENKRIRDLWKETFGFDVWYPYFKAKDVERWAKKKISFRILKMKCTPKFEKKSLVYICKKTF